MLLIIIHIKLTMIAFIVLAVFGTLKPFGLLLLHFLLLVLNESIESRSFQIVTYNVLFCFVIQSKIQIFDHEDVLLYGSQHSQIVWLLRVVLLATQQVLRFIIWIDDAGQVDMANLLIRAVVNLHLLRISLFLKMAKLVTPPHVHLLNILTDLDFVNSDDFGQRAWIIVKE